MARLDDLKRALGGFFYKDLSRYEPGKQGVAIGENIRISLEGDSFLVRFLAETPYNVRKPLLDRLTQAKIPHEVGEDFTL